MRDSGGSDWTKQL